ncbi:MAG TPA: aminotransferase class V-fold PLP-dependent enzyme, partial [Candidatus Methylomirabilis sp.]|nr:aminotransferase class V-fold PLP-dependent enzyme [Candidatus Methylomirabilis sp.]
GHPTERLPQTTNLAFAGVEAESLILALDLQGVGVSSGAACTSGSLEPSHVLVAMGFPRGRVGSSLRFSLGAGTTPEEIDYVLQVLPPIVERMRRLNTRTSPRAGAGVGP